MQRAFKSFLTRTAVGGVLLMPYRLKLGASYFLPQFAHLFSWTWRSRELANFTYDLTPRNLNYLAGTIAAVTGETVSCVRTYISELEQDERLQRHVLERSRAGANRYRSDARALFGRRFGWYAFARTLKPRVIVETGVDKGLGSIVLCSALLRNQAEGFPGSYFGIDINPNAGFLFTDPYTNVGRILYGDSIESLRSLPSIDLFINDSDHSADYERREYETIARKLSPTSVILGDNAHCTDELAMFSVRTNRDFLFFKEEPKEHWYPGAGIGISFVRANRKDKRDDEVTMH